MVTLEIPAVIEQIEALMFNPENRGSIGLLMELLEPPEGEFSSDLLEEVARIGLREALAQGKISPDDVRRFWMNPDAIGELLWYALGSKEGDYYYERVQGLRRA